MNTHAFIMVESMEAIPINGFVGFKLSSLPKTREMLCMELE